MTDRRNYCLIALRLLDKSVIILSSSEIFDSILVDTFSSSLMRFLRFRDGPLDLNRFPLIRLGTQLVICLGSNRTICQGWKDVFHSNFMLIELALFSLKPAVQARFSAVGNVRFFPFLFFHSLSHQVLYRIADPSWIVGLHDILCELLDQAGRNIIYCDAYVQFLFPGPNIS